MSSLAEIVRQYGDEYQKQFGAQLLPSHRRTLHDIAQCRTATFGGHIYQCTECDEVHYHYHSCQNRHCPQCKYNVAQEWLAKQQALLLPVLYFMVTFTLPEAVRKMARRNQRVIYNLLFRISAAALKKLSWDPRYVGGQVGMVGVLHTWGRNLSYHPHVHYLVPAGGLSADEQKWVASRHNFLVPVKALSCLFRAKFRDALSKTDLFAQVPPDVWCNDWVVHCKPVGDGKHALKYLAPYIFRVAISNNRILKSGNGKVTFRYRVSDTGQIRTCTLTAKEFLRRFLQHVLPKGFVKVRYYGLFSPAKRHLLPVLRLWLGAPELETNVPEESLENTSPLQLKGTVICPACGQAMRMIQTLRSRPRCPL